MAVHVTGKHFHIEETLLERIVGRVNSFVSDYLSESTIAHVVVSKENAKENKFFRTDVSVNVSRSFASHCRGEDHDAFRSLCLALDRLETRVKRHRTKLHDQKRHNHIDRETYHVQKYVVQPQEEDSKEQDHPLVIAAINMQVSPLTGTRLSCVLSCRKNLF